jgi:hypothetical protein
LEVQIKPINTPSRRTSAAPYVSRRCPRDRGMIVNLTIRS